jgi:general secretion pathway protein A
MYLDFYALKKVPFHLTPDPEFLFLSPSHKTALGSLIYGIEERQGFVALIGEVGVGKTTLLRAYLERVDRRQLKTIYIFHSNVSFRDLLKTVYREFGLEMPSEDLFEAVNHLYQVLIEEYQQGRNVTLIVDEAQNMPLETLEHLRMLSNLETSTQKLVQIVLAGQPELETKLNLHELRQLKQRIAVWATIAPLTATESIEYIQHRLAKALITEQPVFTPGALRHIAKYAQGIPRVLNILCTNALISGFGYRAPRITAKIAREVAAEYRGKQPRWFLRPWLLIPAGIAVLLALFWVSPYRQPVLAKVSQTVDLQRLLTKVRGTPAPTITTTPSTSRSSTPAAGAARTQAPGELSRPQTVPAIRDTAPSRTAPATVGPVGSPATTSASTPATPLAQPPPSTSVAPPTSDSTTRVAGIPRPTSSAPTGTPVVKTVKRGDVISKLAVEVYGVTSPEIIEWVKKHNSHVTDIDRIQVGELLTFPPLPNTP